jgi:outer membrane protein TolC
MQMSCINSKAPQAIQPMNPVALGLAASPFAQMGMMMADPNNPAQMALLHDRQKQLYQQQLNHHGIMAMAAMHNNQAGGQQQGGTSQPWP